MFPFAVLGNGCSLVHVKETNTLRSPGFPQNYTYIAEDHCLQYLLYTGGQSMYGDTKRFPGRCVHDISVEVLHVSI